ncbi:hypothetical protein [Streptomyces olivochromogenes]|uniref:hypothetical protein n=1 Tax=Streptomyces olivochromogenes TaxID=1963 RepID=UPI001F46A4BF|nr:hypothetical protein [Streptomyces olivochromogenes]MCF3134759.1 hypothetical protein [Streptomyces olivochromogenes]
MIEQLARAHMSWGLGSADRWDLDQTTGIITWTFPEINADAQAASTLMALAVRVTEATGYYKGPGNNSSVIITFGPVPLTNADGSVSTFNIN